MALVTIMNAAVLADRARQLDHENSVLPAHDDFVDLVISMLCGSTLAR
jgi:hypothetical protein